MAATAIVVPVAEAEPAVGRLRRAHTSDGADGMPPHVTLIYPFVDDSRLDELVLDGVRGVLAAFAPFEVRFGAFGRFEADPPVLYLEPAPAQPFLDVIAAIAARFPDHPPFGGVHETVIPHVTIAYTDDAGVLAAAEVEVAAHLPIAARAAGVQVMEHRPAEGWRCRERIPLRHG